MKKFVLILAVAGLMGAGTAVPSFACEGGKCKKEHTQQDNSKAKKGKKAAKEESCHMTAAAGEKTAGKTMSCCMKKEANSSDNTKETKAKPAQR